MTLLHAKGLHQSGKLAEAIAIYRQLLAADSSHAEARYLLAAACDSLGRQDEAIAELAALIERRPDHPQAHNLLGALLAERGDFESAITHFEWAARSNPAWSEPRENLSRARANQLVERGLAHVAAKQFEQGVACYREALTLQPSDIAARGNLGNALHLQGHLDDAAECYLALLAQAPDLAAVHYSLGTVRTKQRRYDEAAQHLRRAVALAPDDAQAHCELGRVMLEQNRLDDALAAYRRAVGCAPDSAAAHFHLAFALLLAGEFEAGWREYEWRLKLPGARREMLDQPQWTGESLAGRTLLVRDEQGFGDALQFARLAEPLARAGAKVVVECHRSLARLLATCPGVSQVVASGESRPAFDWQVWRQSLPGVLGVAAGTIPAKVPYFFVDRQSVDRWRERIGDHGDFRVGIVWQGDPGHANDRHRSFPLTQYAGVARLSGVKLYSLQVAAAGREQLAAVQDSWPIADLAEACTDFYETAAAMQHLDLVIACDSAPAHLAGALGRAVWVALPFAPDWRWQLARDDSPWYPSMRLFRQPAPGDWEGTFRRIEVALATTLQTGRGSGGGATRGAK